jgi:uncharacterized membrane protein YuzA (DUF378 family)
MASSAANKLLIISLVLVVIGALNWLWVGITSNNLVSSLNNATFKNQTFERIIYVLIGLAGLYVLFNIGKLVNAPAY